MNPTDDKKYNILTLDKSELYKIVFYSTYLMLINLKLESPFSVDNWILYKPGFYTVFR